MNKRRVLSPTAPPTRCQLGSWVPASNRLLPSPQPPGDAPEEEFRVQAGLEDEGKEWGGRPLSAKTPATSNVEPRDALPRGQAWRRGPRPDAGLPGPRRRSAPAAPLRSNRSMARPADRAGWGLLPARRLGSPAGACAPPTWPRRRVGAPAGARLLKRPRRISLPEREIIKAEGSAICSQEIFPLTGRYQNEPTTLQDSGMDGQQCHRLTG